MESSEETIHSIMTFLSALPGFVCHNHSLGRGQASQGTSTSCACSTDGCPRCVCLLAQCRQCLSLGPVSPPQPAGLPASRGFPCAVVVSMHIFPGCTRVSRPTRILRFYIIYDRCRQHAFRISLVRNCHTPVQRLRINDHGGVVFGHGARQLALGLGEPLADGEHAVDDDRVYTLLYLALQFWFG